MKKTDISVKLANLKLKNPVITASGTSGFGKELEEYISLNDIGAITLKGLTLNPRKGNPTPRIAETPCGILNSIGLENPGVNSFINNQLSLLNNCSSPVIANISGHSIDEYTKLAEKLNPHKKISALEINVSCPNLKKGGMAFGINSEQIYTITSNVRKVFNREIIVKLTPNVSDIVKMAQAAKEGGADILSLINTLQGIAIDIDSEKPVLANTFGGLSGPAIKPVALRMVYQVYSSVNIPIIGMGGISSGKDAIEFIMAGASAVGVGTATLVDPYAILRIIKEIEEILQNKNIDNLNNLRGKAQ
ncbi:MAG: dihydroorotate dehydrogenase [Bacillota bacterium]